MNSELDVTLLREDEREIFVSALPGAYFDHEQMLTVLRRLIEERGRQRWIPVDEVLPEDDGLVLALIDRADEYPLRDIGWYEKEDRRWHWRLEHKETCQGEVTHWQPLPAPPEKGKP